MLGAFFMATKRFAEYRHIGNRRDCGWLPPVVPLLHGGASARQHVLLRDDLRPLCRRVHRSLPPRADSVVPVGAGVFAYYLSLGLQPDSPTQNPEKLYKQRGFFAYMVLATVLFVVLMLTHIPAFYAWFNVEPSTATPLWILGKGQN
jgi:hypothetical protein